MDPQFIAKYAKLRPPFGFNGLGELVYLRTYSRNIGGRKEQWHETVERVVRGTFQMQADWLHSTGLPCDQPQMDELRVHSEDMYDRIFHMKMLPTVLDLILRVLVMSSADPLEPVAHLLT